MELALFEALILSLGAIGFGTFLLIKGGDWTVDSAVYIAERYGVSPLVIGFTVLAFGTSLPELLVSVIANLQGSAGIAIGNVLGSNIANIALVLAVGAIIAPLIAKSVAVRRDLIFMLIATAIFAALLVTGEISRLAGGGMIVLLIIYIIYQYNKAKSGCVAEIPEADLDDEPSHKSMKMAVLFLILGLIGIALGAEFLVRGARIGASAIGVPDAVIALSLIAFGTSLPELSTSIIAARKGHSDMMLGNIVGSNVFNVLLIIGVAALVKPITADMYSPQLVDFDIWVTAAVSVIFAFIIFAFKKMTRTAGIIFLTAYVLYNIYIYAINMTA